MNPIRIVKVALRGAERVVSMAVLVVVALVGVSRLVAAVIGFGLGTYVRREIAVRRFRRRLRRKGLPEEIVEEFTRRYRSILPLGKIVDISVSR